MINGLKNFIQLAFDWGTCENSDAKDTLTSSITNDFTQDFAQNKEEKPFVAGKSLKDVMPYVHFVHPRSNQNILLENTYISYELIRTQRKSIGFSINSDGLVVRAPKWVSLTSIQGALQDKRPWIIKKLEQLQEKSKKQKVLSIEWRDKAQFFYYGDLLTLFLDDNRDNESVKLDEQNLVLHIGLPQKASAAQIRDVVQSWLMSVAKDDFTRRLEHFAPKLGVKWQKLSLSNAHSRWGSAKSDGSIRLHWRLIHFKPHIIDYVVVHELSHLREMNHSQRFWQTVQEALPDYKIAKRELKEQNLAPW